jgi:hypothetical protein
MGLTKEVLSPRRVLDPCDLRPARPNETPGFLVIVMTCVVIGDLIVRLLGAWT